MSLVIATFRLLAVLACHPRGHAPLQGSSITDNCSRTPHCRWVSSEDLASADLQHSRQLGQFRLILVGVVLAEEKLSFGRQLGAYASRGTAAVAAVCPSQLGTGQSCVHGFSRFSYIHCLRRIVECRRKQGGGPESTHHIWR